MRFSELYLAKVRDPNGTLLGRVRAVHVKQGAITHVGVGSGALLRRLTGRAHERRISWDRVIALKDGELVVDAEEGT